MNQNEEKRRNATHNKQQRFTTSFSLPCPQRGRFWQPLYYRKRLYLLGHFKDEFHFLSIYMSLQDRVSIKAARKANI